MSWGNGSGRRKTHTQRTKTRTASRGVARYVAAVAENFAAAATFGAAEFAEARRMEGARLRGEAVAKEGRLRPRLVSFPAVTFWLPGEFFVLLFLLLAYEVTFCQVSFCC